MDIFYPNWSLLFYLEPTLLAVLVGVPRHVSEPAELLLISVDSSILGLISFNNLLHMKNFQKGFLITKNTDFRFFLSLDV